jgi:two-component system KDP operon response regulator KdpE
VRRALVVDDEAQIGRALRRGLETDDLEVVIATTGNEALDLAAAHPPDIAIVDLGLPDLDGIELIRQLRSWSEVPVIVLSGAGSEATKVGAFTAGADDYVTKPFGLDELRVRVEAVLRRSQPRGEESRLAFGDLSVDLARQAVWVQGQPVRLTAKEFGLLRVLVDNPGRLLTHWWLLDQVWGRGVGEEGRQYLRVYVGQLRRKLGDDAKAPRYILTEPGIGYRWIAEPDGEI